MNKLKLKQNKFLINAHDKMIENDDLKNMIEFVMMYTGFKIESKVNKRNIKLKVINDEDEQIMYFKNEKDFREYAQELSTKFENDLEND